MSSSSFEYIQYEVEGGIDFFKELKNISSAAPASAPESGKYCLLTDELLRPDAVTLKCGHSFNYIPIYKDVLFQKCSTLPKNISSKITALYTKTMNPNSIGYTSSPSPSTSFQNVQTMTYNSSINLETTKLHYDEIKCPYCRDITPKLLPYYPYPEVNQVKYVNSPSNLCLKGVACEYFKLTDKTCDSSPTYNEQYGLLCRTHMKKVASSGANIPKPKPESKSKSKKTKPVNSIVSHIDPTTLQTTTTISDTTTTKCGFLLLTGARKGQPCGCNATASMASTASTASTTPPACKRHYNKCMNA
jgi:hypothetical protein